MALEIFADFDRNGKANHIKLSGKIFAFIKAILKSWCWFYKILHRSQFHFFPCWLLKHIRTHWLDFISVMFLISTVKIIETIFTKIAAVDFKCNPRIKCKTNHFHGNTWRHEPKCQSPGTDNIMCAININVFTSKMIITHILLISCDSGLNFMKGLTTTKLSSEEIKQY